MLINAFCENKGWLFADLLRLYAAAGAVVSPQPLPKAAAWICVRTDEWLRCPDPSRLVLQVHDLWPHSWPETVGGLVLTHRSQRPATTPRFSLLRPLGALRSMMPRPRVKDGRFTVGWVGRPAKLRSVDVKSPEPLIEALRVLAARLPCRLILAGCGLGLYATAAARIPGLEVVHCDRATYPLDQYPTLYASMDTLCVTSTIDAGPLPLFEALACGTPVLSTPVGWAPHFLDGSNGWIYEPGALLPALEEVRARVFSPEAVRATLRETWLDGPGGWIEQTFDLARMVAA